MQKQKVKSEGEKKTLPQDKKLLRRIDGYKTVAVLLSL